MTAGRHANQMRVQAAMLAGLVGRPKIGIVTSYDGSAGSYLAKVSIQPEDYETGWLPIEVIQGGNGWGVYAAPHAGDQAVVHFLEGDKEVGWVTGFLPNDVDAAPAVPEGEIHLIHKQGQFAKLLTDGSISAQAGSGSSVATLQLKPDGTIASSGAWTHTGTLHVTDTVTLDKDLNVAGNAAFTGSSVTHGGVNIGKTHVHSGVQTGSGVSLGPQ